MSLSGTYVNNSTGETLTITGNDANGQISGTLTANGKQLAVNGHYHYNNSGGPATSIIFTAMADDPNFYEAWAASGSAPSFTQLNAAGGRATISNGTASTVALGGSFMRK